ncbi:MAG: AraC family ligand binding domain-containing protein, partial [Deltaproteobacteria bacterium]|nr:AraC family ligand binding domain-containing protein [Deltaproteobacteria bacterium]
MISTRAPRLAWRKRRDDAFPISVFRRDGQRVVHLERMHAHDFFTILVVESGQGTVQLVGKTLTLSRGDVHLLPPGEPHDTARLSDVAGWVIEFTADALGDAHGFFGAPCGRPMWIGFQPLGGLGGGRLTLGEEAMAR